MGRGRFWGGFARQRTARVRRRARRISGIRGGRWVWSTFIATVASFEEDKVRLRIPSVGVCGSPRRSGRPRFSGQEDRPDECDFGQPELASQNTLIGESIKA